MLDALTGMTLPPLLWRRLAVLGLSGLVGALLLGCGVVFPAVEAGQQGCDGASPLGLALLIIGASLWTRRAAARFALLALGGGVILLLALVVGPFLPVTLQIAPALLALSVAAMLSGPLLDGFQAGERKVEAAAATLGDLGALERAAGGVGGINIVAARIEDFADHAAMLGPGAASGLMKRVAERLRAIQPHRTLYRIDEASLAWIEAPGDEQSLDDRIDHLAKAMQAPLDCGRPVEASLNFGLATGERAGVRLLAAQASLAAQQASQKGIRWERYHGVEAEAPRWRLALPRELDMAMVSGQLWNAYQPQLDIGSGAIVGAEVLVRWLHPLRGPIPPASFIPLIEERGRARDLTAHVLTQALEDAVAWERAGYSMGIAINVSQSLLADHAFIELIGQILQGSPLPARRVTIEISERAAMSSPDRALAALSSWRSHGLRIAIDNYGTGQASNPYLERFPATELKIDRSLVQALAPGSRAEKLVQSAIALAHERGMKAVAEGVEDAACLEMLAAMGCDVAQGFFIGRPMPGNALAEFLGEQNRAVA